MNPATNTKLNNFASKYVKYYLDTHAFISFDGFEYFMSCNPADISSEQLIDEFNFATRKPVQLTLF